MADNPEESAARAREALPEGLVHIVPAEMHVEFTSPPVNKGAGLARLCAETLGIALQDVVAFGDNHNDRNMLELVGEGVAMRNAKEGTKQAADRVSRWSNDEEGIA